MVQESGGRDYKPDGRSFGNRSVAGLTTLLLMGGTVTNALTSSDKPGVGHQRRDENSCRTNMPVMRGNRLSNLKKLEPKKFADVADAYGFLSTAH
jgi:hypothetical protein